MLQVVKPEIYEQTFDWFQSLMINYDFSKLDIVLISDSRSYFLATYVLQIPEFAGQVLITEGSYRIGRLSLRESRRIQENDESVPPIYPSVFSMNFFQTFSYQELTFIPVPNGTGLGNCNWIISKGNDPGLVTFAVFVITGYCSDSFFHHPYIPQMKIDVVIRLPYSESLPGYTASVKAIADRIIMNAKNYRHAVIPCYIDDSLIALIGTLINQFQITTAYSRIHICSFYYRFLANIMTSIPCQTQISLDYFTSDNPDDIPPEGLIFAPHPSLKAGQITRFLTNLEKAADFIFIEQFPNVQTELQYQLNSSVSSLNRFITDVNCPVVLTTPSPPIAVSSCFVRWIDTNHLPKQTQGSNQIITGEFEGERVIVGQANKQNIVNVPPMKEIAMRLFEEGATKVWKEDNRLMFEFMYLGPDYSGCIRFDDDDVEVETNNEEIEELIAQTIIHL